MRMKCCELRLRVTRRGDERPVLPLVDERDDVGVVEEVAQLLLDVAEVDVHRRRADLVDREHRLDPLDAVRRVDADVVAGLARPRRWSVCASRFARSSSSRVGDPPALVDDRDAVGHLVGGELEQVGEVEVSRSSVIQSTTWQAARTQREQQVRGGGSRSSSTRSGASTPHTQPFERREPHLHEDARDAHLAVGRVVALGALDRAGDDRRHDLGDPPHDVGVLAAAPSRTRAPSPRSTSG